MTSLIITLFFALLMKMAYTFTHTWDQIPYKNNEKFNGNITVDMDIYYTSTYRAGPDVNGYLGYGYGF